MLEKEGDMWYGCGGRGTPPPTRDGRVDIHTHTHTLFRLKNRRDLNSSQIQKCTPVIVIPVVGRRRQGGLWVRDHPELYRQRGGVR